jgi:hypothetical protein
VGDDQHLLAAAEDGLPECNIMRKLTAPQGEISNVCF